MIDKLTLCLPLNLWSFRFVFQLRVSVSQSQWLTDRHELNFLHFYFTRKRGTKWSMRGRLADRRVQPLSLQFWDSILPSNFQILRAEFRFFDEFYHCYGRFSRFFALIWWFYYECLPTRSLMAHKKLWLEMMQYFKVASWDHFSPLHGFQNAPDHKPNTMINLARCCILLHLKKGIAGIIHDMTWCHVVLGLVGFMWGILFGLLEKPWNRYSLHDENLFCEERKSRCSYDRITAIRR